MFKLNKLIKKITTILLTSFVVVSCSKNYIQPQGLDIFQNVNLQNKNLSFIKNNTHNSKWKDEIIYFALTDRFCNGDNSNDFNVDKNNIKAYHGGDLQGLINKLDYIKNLGVTTIWLSPIVDNRDTDFFGNWGYHGYWAKDLYKVDEHLGDLNKFKQLVNTAHSKGLKILLDIVFNHVDYDHPIAVGRHQPGSKYYSWFHHNGDIQDSNNQWWVENGELGGLPDFDQSNPEVVKYLVDFAKWWIKNTGVDGYRIDTVKHVQKDFWKTLTNELHQYAGSNFFLLGEVLHGDIGYCSDYAYTGFDSLFDFPLYFVIDRALKYGNSMREFSSVFSQDNRYPDASFLSPFIDNHDVPRFISDPNNLTQLYRFMLAQTLQMTIRGIPTIYYGDEIGLPGGAEPFNRVDMNWNNPENSIVYKHLQNLIKIRKQYKALRHGAQLEMWSDDNVYAFSRLMPDQEVIVILNNSIGNIHRTIPLRVESQLQNGTQLINLLKGDTITINNRSIDVSLDMNSAKIYVVKNRK